MTGGIIFSLMVSCRRMLRMTLSAALSSFEYALFLTSRCLRLDQ